MKGKEYQPVWLSDLEAFTMLKQLAKTDFRGIGNQVVWLIRQEWARRYSTPQTGITVEDAIAANDEVSR